MKFNATENVALF